MKLISYLFLLSLFPCRFEFSSSEVLTHSLVDLIIMFRIKIWDKDDGDSIVYDNQMDAAEDADPTTQIGGGSIVIHKSK